MSRKRVAFLISGGGSNMISLVDSMGDPHAATPALVLSNNPNAGGLTKAAAKGIATVVVDHRPFKGDRTAFEAAIHDKLVSHRIDIICLAGFMRILAVEFTDKWQGRMLNVHPSLLPKYRGLHTHRRAIEAGDKVHGCTVHEVTGKLDDGPILGQAQVLVLADDTPEILAKRVLEMEHRIYPAVLARFARGDNTPVYLP